MAENLHAGHREKMKKRFLKHGLDSFEPHNVLELLLFYAIPRKDTNVIAHRLIKRFGSISAVMDAPIEELQKVEGVGENAATLIKLIPQLSRLYLEGLNKSNKLLDSADKIGDYLLPKFVGMTVEGVYLLCLDNRGHLLYEGAISSGGTVNASSVTLRTIVEAAIRCQATAVVIAHNHPKGFAIQSEADLAATHEIAKHLKAIGVELKDHIIVAANDYVSLAQSGML